MSSQTIRSFRLQSRFLRRLAALLAVLLLPSAASAAVGRAASQKDGQEAARKAFDEGERLRQQATPDSLRGAVEKYQEAIKLWHAGRDGKDETAALASLGLTFQLLQQHERAVEVYEQALTLLRESGERPEEGDILYNLGTAQLFLGRFDKAAETYERALAIERRAGDRAAEANTLAYLGAADERMGQYGEAIDNFERALAIHRALRSGAPEGVLLNSIGAAYSDLGRYDRALEQYQQALEAYRAARDRADEGTTLANAGYAFYKLGQTARAVEYYERALSIQRELADRLQEANTLTKLGLAQLAEGRTADALATSQRALALHRELHDGYGEGRTLDALGQVSRALGKNDQSLEELGAALALMRRLGALAGEGATLGELMLTCKARGSTRLAIFYGKQAVNAFQEIRQNISGLEKRSQESFVGARQETYRTLAGLLIAAGRLGEAQQVLDLLKQDEYRQFIRRGGAETGAPARAALSPEEAALDAQYREVSDRVASIGHRWGELSAKEQLTPEEQKQLADLEKQLEVANAAFQKFLDRLEDEFGRAQTGGDTVYQLREAEGLKETLRELGGGAVALYTVVGEKKLYVVLYTPDAMIAREYPVSAEELYAKIFAFREAVQNPKADPRPAARELYNIVVGPVAKDLEQAKAETLMWSLDGALRYIPVAALYDGEHYMVERYRNVVFTPATQANLKDQPRAQSKGVGFGVSKAHGDFIALPSVPEELHSIFRADLGVAPAPAGAAGVLSGKVMMDEEFTGEALRSSLRLRYPVVHIASHFAFRPGDETDSYLLLGDGTHLSLAQVKAAANLFGGVDLLTLSACDTASGGAGGDGKEVEGFAVLAQRQGAKAVVASLWPVADSSTRLLMAEFYRLRGEGMTKAEALRRAQSELLGGDAQTSGGERRGLSLGGGAAAPAAKFSHPYFWAPFILIGNWK
ncbi:MAG: CHAT domain-containing protein [Acidobacteriota bacterium]|nr:CHAT domain-containing protein [Acidobacteriota bacterium]